MTVTETKPTEDSMPLKEGPNYYGGQGGSASVHDRTGLLIAIIALTVTAFFSAFAVMAYMANRDQVSSLKDDIIKLETEVKDLQIELEEFKNRK